MQQALDKKGITPPKPAGDLLTMYYLQARSYLLETAAILDRIERAPGGEKALEDSRVQDLFKICDLIKNEKANRAEKLLMMLSV